jgi:hypothetical protein
MVILRDGRKLLGVFRSYDQFGASPPLPTSRTVMLISFLLCHLSAILPIRLTLIFCHPRYPISIVHSKLPLGKHRRAVSS